jgi:hypothetical protein
LGRESKSNFLTKLWQLHLLNQAGNSTTSTTAVTATTALNSNLLGNIASTGFMRTRGTLSGDIDADWGDGYI